MDEAFASRIASADGGPDHGACRREGPSARRLRVLIAADTRLYRDGLAYALRERAQAMEIEASPGEGELLEAVGAAPDVLLLDVSMPCGLETLREVKARAPGVPVLALGISEVEPDVVACAEAGASGYVGKEASLDDLLSAIQAVVRGELQCPPKIAALLFRRVAALAAELPPVTASATLTPREREVSTLLDRGWSNKQIARELRIRTSTVKNHVHNILEKLNVRRRGEAALRTRAQRGHLQGLSR